MPSFTRILTIKHDIDHCPPWCHTCYISWHLVNLFLTISPTQPGNSINSIFIIWSRATETTVCLLLFNFPFCILSIKLYSEQEFFYISFSCLNRCVDWLDASRPWFDKYKTLKTYMLWLWYYNYQNNLLTFDLPLQSCCATVNLNFTVTRCFYIQYKHINIKSSMCCKLVSVLNKSNHWL